jgi:hypothetical protein
MFLPNMFFHLPITHFIVVLAPRDKALGMMIILCMRIIVTARKTHLMLFATRVIVFVVFIVLAFVLEPQLAVAALLAVVCTMYRAQR